MNDIRHKNNIGEWVTDWRTNTFIEKLRSYKQSLTNFYSFLSSSSIECILFSLALIKILIVEIIFWLTFKWQLLCKAHKNITLNKLYCAYRSASICSICEFWGQIKSVGGCPKESTNFPLFFTHFLLFSPIVTLPPPLFSNSYFLNTTMRKDKQKSEKYGYLR